MQGNPKIVTTIISTYLRPLWIKTASSSSGLFSSGKMETIDSLLKTFECDNGPFAKYSQIIQKTPCWMANDAVGPWKEKTFAF